MLRAAVAAAVVLTAVPARAEGMRFFSTPEPHELVLQGMALAAIAADVGTTLEFRAKGVEETNPLLGRRPSVLRVVAVGGLGGMAATTLVWWALPCPFRDVFSIGVIGVESAVVHMNLTW